MDGWTVTHSKEGLSQRSEDLILVSVAHNDSYILWLMNVHGYHTNIVPTMRKLPRQMF